MKATKLAEQKPRGPDDWKNSFFVVESQGDGAESVIVFGIEAAQLEMKRLMWNDDGEPEDDVKATIASLTDLERWTKPYPDYEPMVWEERFEDGGVRVLRITDTRGLTNAKRN